MEAALAPPRGDAKNGLDNLDPVSVSGARAQVLRRPAGFSFIAATDPGDVSITVRLKRPLRDRETVHLFVYSAEGTAFVRQDAQPRGSSQAAPERLSSSSTRQPLHEGWMFFEIVLTRGATFRTQYVAQGGRRAPPSSQQSPQFPMRPGASSTHQASGSSPRTKPVIEITDSEGVTTAAEDDERDAPDADERDAET